MRHANSPRPARGSFAPRSASATRRLASAMHSPTAEDTAYLATSEYPGT